MNWYTIIKLAFPIMEKRNPYDLYEDFRHEGDDLDYVENDTLLWFIDTSFNFHVTPVTPEVQTHWGWQEFDYFVKGKEIIYQGRYDKRKQKASATRMPWKSVDPKFERMFANREDKLMSRIERIIDNAFNNPTILTF